MAVGSDTEAAGLACLDRFMDAVNAHDVLAMEREMHFPHVRIAAGTIATYAAPGSNPLDLFDLYNETTAGIEASGSAKRSCRAMTRKSMLPFATRACARTVA